MPKKPDLVVSGINYGENVGLGITISGTVGAAMEAASLGLPALAVSLRSRAAISLLLFAGGGFFRGGTFRGLLWAHAPCKEDAG